VTPRHTGFRAGSRLGRDAAVGLALGEAASRRRRSVPGRTAGPAWQPGSSVARLVAEGLSNKQIGVRPFISERTVDNHVHSILDKLGFNSRAQIASWMASSDQ
jgi:regulatory LuxR family protein